MKHTRWGWWALAAALAVAGCDELDQLLATDAGLGGGPDGGVAGDAAVRPDGGEPLPDAGPETDAGPDPDAGPPPACDLGAFGPADRDRVVLVGFPFGEPSGPPRTEVGGFTLGADGRLVAGRTRLDVGDRPRRILFVPSGELALVLGERGRLVSVRVGGADDLEVLDAVQLPPADYGDLALADDGFTLYVAGSNSTPEGGLSTVLLDCDGSLTVVPEAFFPLRLTDSFALLPGGERAVVRGGQALFDPVDHDDLRLLERTPDGWVELAAADVFTDYVNTARLGLSPDGARVLIPNGSIFSEEFGHVAEVAIAGLDLAETGRLRGLDDPREVLFSPDGRTALLTLGEPGVVVVLRERDGRMSEASRVRGIGLADQMALVARGALAGRVLLPSVDPDARGSNLAQLHIDGPGQVRDLGQLDLGGGAANIPTAIGVQP